LNFKPKQMKKITLLLTVCLIALFSCKKATDDIQAANTPAPLTAKFTLSQVDNVFENQHVTMTPAYQDGASYVWHISNATKLLDKNAVLSIPYHGNYTVELTVTDSKGNTATQSQDIIHLCNFLGGAANHNPPTLLSSLCMFRYKPLYS